MSRTQIRHHVCNAQYTDRDFTCVMPSTERGRVRRCQEERERGLEAEGEREEAQGRAKNLIRYSA
eukprot:2109513-Rhodomonas_salina.1